MQNLTKIKSKKRLDQIRKILKYAKEILQIDVSFVDPKEMGNDCGGYLAPKGQRKGQITISNDYNGIMTILILLHEIGHHIDFLKRGYVEAEDIAYAFYPESKNESCPIKHRKLIRHVEEQAIKYSYELATYLDLKLPAYHYLKDELFTRLSLEMILKKGPIGRDELIKLKKRTSKQAKHLIKTLYNNSKTLPLINK